MRDARAIKILTTDDNDTYGARELKKTIHIEQRHEPYLGSDFVDRKAACREPHVVDVDGHALLVAATAQEQGRVCAWEMHGTHAHTHETHADSQQMRSRMHAAEARTRKKKRESVKRVSGRCWHKHMHPHAVSCPAHECIPAACSKNTKRLRARKERASEHCDYRRGDRSYRLRRWGAAP